MSMYFYNQGKYKAIFILEITKIKSTRLRAGPTSGGGPSTAQGSGGRTP